MNKSTNSHTFALGALIAAGVYCMGSLLQEFIIKKSYTNLGDDSEERMTLPNFFILVGSLISWALAAWCNRKVKFTGNNNTSFSESFVIVEALLVFISLLTFTKAIYLTGFPLAMMFKSCSIISSGPINVFFPEDPQQYSTPKNRSITTIIFVGVGLIFFCIGGIQQKQLNKTGVELLLISLLCDAILRKMQKKEGPHNFTQLKRYEIVSRGVVIFSLIYSICTGQIVTMIWFVITHPVALLHLLFFGVFCAVSRITIFQMNNYFQANKVNLLLIVRKITTVLLSLFLFNHKIVSLQFLGILVTIAAYAEEFYMNQKKIIFKKHYCEKNKYSVCLLEEPYEVNEGTIFKVQLEVPVVPAQQKEWRERYDMLKLIQQIYPPTNIIEYIERENIEQIPIDSAKIDDPEERKILVQEIKSIQNIKDPDEQQENGSTEENGSTDSKE